MKNSKNAFLWIINILKENNIKYRISGGLAARIYGSKRKLADIDIEIYKKDIPKIYKKVKEFVIFGPKQYKDKNWDLILMTIKYRNQEIDIAPFDSKIFDQYQQKWIRKPGKFNDVSLKFVFGKRVLVEKLDSLIKYKKALAREVDIKDIKQLS